MLRFEIRQFLHGEPDTEDSLKPTIFVDFDYVKNETLRLILRVKMKEIDNSDFGFVLSACELTPPIIFSVIGALLTKLVITFLGPPRRQKSCNQLCEIMLQSR